MSQLFRLTKMLNVISIPDLHNVPLARLVLCPPTTPLNRYLPPLIPLLTLFFRVLPHSFPSSHLPTRIQLRQVRKRRFQL
jgi:hypothetical protein